MSDAPKGELVVGTRGSALALWQTRHVAARLQALHGTSVREKIIVTEGDVNKAERLAGKIEKGFFTVELERELLAGTIDFAVHSLKDLPTRVGAGLDLVAVLERADACDLLVAHRNAVLLQGAGRLPLKAGVRVGTSSLRRDALIKTFAPHALSLPLRGNVPTRIQKLVAGHYDAIILAAAGVRRLGIDLSAFAVFELDPRWWPPAPGQGSVAVEARADDGRVQALFAALDHAPSRTACERERSFLRALEGGCTTPFGCYALGESAWMGRAGLEGESAPWRALHLELPPLHTPLTDAQLADGLARLTASSLTAPTPQDPAHDAPLFQEVRSPV